MHYRPIKKSLLGPVFRNRLLQIRNTVTRYLITQNIFWGGKDQFVIYGFQMFLI